MKYDPMNNMLVDGGKKTTDSKLTKEVNDLVSHIKQLESQRKDALKRSDALLKKFRSFAEDVEPSSNEYKELQKEYDTLRAVTKKLYYTPDYITFM